MPIPSSGPVTLSDLQTEFGGSDPISLSEYYAGGGRVPSGTSGTSGPVPSSGQIAISNFYGTTNAVYMTATGGTITTDGNYKIHTFTGNGTFTVTNAGTGYPEAGQVTYLVVAGGGAGATNGGISSNNPGSGGAGGYLTSTYPVSATSYPVTVGAGGTGVSPIPDPGEQPRGAAGPSGSNSSAFSITATGGGGGGYFGSPSGGSGGGGAYGSGTSYPGGAGTPGQGYPGGAAHSPTQSGGGGGGAGGSGGTAGPQGGPAGPGASNSITGSSVTYARGGQWDLGAGGSNTGNGGARGSPSSAGGSGIVIVRYRYQA